MEWAVWALEYLRDARAKVHDDFSQAMLELREYKHARGETWYHSCKNIIQTLYHFSMEFVEEVEVPSNNYSSPQAVAVRLEEYRLFVVEMRRELVEENSKYQASNKIDGSPFLVTVAMRHVVYFLDAVTYVKSEMPEGSGRKAEADDIALVINVSRRFHESVLSLGVHPHGGKVLKIENEWDCQYLFRSILAGIFADIRDEEWNPSVGGSSARCEFFLRNLRLMIELKYVRKNSDAKKIKGEIAKDLLDYGGNPLVDSAIFLVYDPLNVLRNPIAFQKDLGGPTRGLKFVEVVLSPRRGD